MARKKTNVDLVLSLPSSLSKAVLDAMTPRQKRALSAKGAGQIITVMAEASRQVADILDNEAPDDGTDDEEELRDD